MRLASAWRPLDHRDTPIQRSLGPLKARNGPATGSMLGWWITEMSQITDTNMFLDTLLQMQYIYIYIYIVYYILC